MTVFPLSVPNGSYGAAIDAVSKRAGSPEALQ
jgi:hypothetical protein